MNTHICDWPRLKTSFSDINQQKYVPCMFEICLRNHRKTENVHKKQNSGFY